MQSVGCRSLHRHGFRHLYFVNGHGGNTKPIMRRMDEYKDKLKVNLRFQSYWDVYDLELAHEVMENKALPGHACEYETSTMLVLDPKRVHEDDIDNENAALGTAEKGNKLIEPAIAGVAGILEKMIAGEEIDCPPVTFRTEGRFNLVTGEPA